MVVADRRAVVVDIGGPGHFAADRTLFQVIVVALLVMQAVSNNQTISRQEIAQ
jgi:hypothetical protein